MVFKYFFSVFLIIQTDLLAFRFFIKKIKDFFTIIIFIIIINTSQALVCSCYSDQALLHSTQRDRQTTKGSEAPVLTAFFRSFISTVLW